MSRSCQNPDCSAFGRPVDDDDEHCGYCGGEIREAPAARAAEAIPRPESPVGIPPDLWAMFQKFVQGGGGPGPVPRVNLEPIPKPQPFEGPLPPFGAGPVGPGPLPGAVQPPPGPTTVPPWQPGPVADIPMAPATTILLDLPDDMNGTATATLRFQEVRGGTLWGIVAFGLVDSPQDAKVERFEGPGGFAEVAYKFRFQTHGAKVLDIRLGVPVRTGDGHWAWHCFKAEAVRFRVNSASTGVNVVVEGGIHVQGHASDGITIHHTDLGRMPGDTKSIEGYLTWHPAAAREFLPRMRTLQPVRRDRDDHRAWPPGAPADRLCLDVSGPGQPPRRVFVFACPRLLIGRTSERQVKDGITREACDVVLRFVEDIPPTRDEHQKLNLTISRNAVTVTGHGRQAPVIQPPGMPTAAPTRQPTRGLQGRVLPLLDVDAMPWGRRLSLGLTPIPAADPEPWQVENAHPPRKTDVLGADLPGDHDGAWIRREGDLESHSYLLLYRRIGLGGAGARLPLLPGPGGTEIELAVLGNRIHAMSQSDAVWTLNDHVLLYGEVLPLAPGDVLRSARGEVRVHDVHPERFIEISGAPAQ